MIIFMLTGRLPCKILEGKKNSQKYIFARQTIFKIVCAEKLLTACWPNHLDEVLL